MKLNINVFKIVPSKTSSQIEKVGVSDSICEDVSHFEVNENEITLHFNNGTEDHIHLRDNDGNLNEDWRGFSLFVTRKFLEIDMNS